MSKNVLVISTSLRQNSNSDLLAQQFAQGAREAGHCVEVISLRGKNLQFCNGCMACLKAPRCVIQDDANAIVEKWGPQRLSALPPRSTITRCPAR